LRIGTKPFLVRPVKRTRGADKYRVMN